MGLILVGGIFIAIDSYARSHSRPTPPQANTIGTNSTTTTMDTNTWDVSSEGSTILIPDKISTAMNILVGVFMILLGTYSIYRIYQKIQQQKKASSTDPSTAANFSAKADSELDTNYDDVESLNQNKDTLRLLHTKKPNDEKEQQEQQQQNLDSHSETIITASIVVTPGNSTSRSNHLHSQHDDTIQLQQQDYIHFVEYSHIHNDPSTTIPEQTTDNHPETTTTATATATATHTHHVHSHTVSFGELWNRKPLLALCIGIIHGISGPGSVLGVVPAIQIHNIGRGFLYLGIFCITSTLVMGTFAALYGIISSTISRRCTSCCTWKRYPYLTTAIYIEIFSCFCSFFVGVFFIVLQATHSMDQILGE